MAAGAVFGTVRAFGESSASPSNLSVVRAGTDRGGLRHYLVRGQVAFDAKISTADSKGGIFLWENSMTAKGGPHRHVHFEQDEWFYVLEGEYVAEVGQERFFLNPGDSVFMPRGVPHAWAHLSDGVGRMLGSVQPAGTFEQWVEEVRIASEAGPSTPEEMRELLKKHGMQEIGPPLNVAQLKRNE
jgi:mannose-6-phosphate isomerase-like protein (cupin superfamily)